MTPSSGYVPTHQRGVVGDGDVEDSRPVLPDKTRKTADPGGAALTGDVFDKVQQMDAGMSSQDATPVRQTLANSQVAQEPMREVRAPLEPKVEQIRTPEVEEPAAAAGETRLVWRQGYYLNNVWQRGRYEVRLVLHEVRLVLHHLPPPHASAHRVCGAVLARYPVA